MTIVRINIELHDSKLTQVVCSGAVVELVLAPAYIHRWEGTGDGRTGNGLHQTARLRFDGVTSVVPTANLPCGVSDGELVAEGHVYRNLLPAALAASGSSYLRLDLVDGSMIEVRTARVAIALEGEPTHVEALPPEFDAED